MPKVSLHFLWFDFWIGLFWDKTKKVLYFCPLPMVVIKIETARPGPMRFAATKFPGLIRVYK